MSDEDECLTTLSFIPKDERDPDDICGVLGCTKMVRMVITITDVSGVDPTKYCDSHGNSQYMLFTEDDVLHDRMMSNGVRFKK